MAKVTKAFACANNEVAFISWDVDGMIPDCLGFDIKRVRIDGAEAPKSLAAYVPFDGQKNPDWAPQDTSVWPVQKLSWRDLTLRRHRADTGRREAGFEVKYFIRPVGFAKPGFDPVPPPAEKNYEGDARPLCYLGPAVETNAVTIDLEFDGVRATFTNGILSGQWLRKALESDGKTLSVEVIRNEIEDPASPIRSYLTGDVLETLGLFFTDPRYAKGKVLLALYELKDKELVDLLIANRKRIEVILSNSSKQRDGVIWDATNQDARHRLHEAGVKVQDRMFNNNHIGHNKFAVWLDASGKPKAVMTGSTNWTSTGLCGQSNNAVVIESSDIAEAYRDYWTRLHDDEIEPPKAETEKGSGKQGPEIRQADAEPVEAKHKPGKVTAWFSPNTKRVTKGVQTPPDLADLFSLIGAAKKIVLFLAFLPSRAGLDSIIHAAVDAAEADPNLLVVGAISDATAMPNYVAPDKTAGTPGKSPFVYDTGHTHIVRAAALKDVVGDFEREVPTVGNAIVHDKIVVIDPLSADCVVAFGSHNLGFKASYENDENLLIFRGCRELATAYAVHVLDVYDHYRFRAWQAEDHAHGKPVFEGHIEADDHWLRGYADGKKGDIGRYFLK